MESLRLFRLSYIIFNAYSKNAFAIIEMELWNYLIHYKNTFLGNSLLYNV